MVDMVIGDLVQLEALVHISAASACQEAAVSAASVNQAQRLQRGAHADAAADEDVMMQAEAA